MPSNRRSLLPRPAGLPAHVAPPQVQVNEQQGVLLEAAEEGSGFLVALPPP